MKLIIKKYLFADMHHASDEKRVYNKKIVSISFLKNFVKKENVAVVFTKGVFDIIHAGHLRLFGYCKKLKNLNKKSILVVGVAADSVVKKSKGPSRPINSQIQRAETVASIDYIDYVLLYYETCPIKIIKNLKPKYYIKGQDTALTKNNVKENKIKLYYSEKNPEIVYLNEYGGKLIILCDDSKVSTTKIIKKIIKKFKHGNKILKQHQKFRNKKHL